MPILYYQETETGDYLMVDTDTAQWYEERGQSGMMEGRATALAENVQSVQGTAVSVGYLREHCKRVGKKAVPGEWLRRLGP